MPEVDATSEKAPSNNADSADTIEQWSLALINAIKLILDDKANLPLMNPRALNRSSNDPVPRW